MEHYLPGQRLKTIITMINRRNDFDGDDIADDDNNNDDYDNYDDYQKNDE